MSAQLPSDQIDLKKDIPRLMFSYEPSNLFAHQQAEILKGRFPSEEFQVLDCNDFVDAPDELSNSIRECDCVIVLAPPDYGQSKEVSRAFKFADSKSKYILPVSFTKRWPPEALEISLATTQYITTSFCRRKGRPLEFWPEGNIKSVVYQLIMEIRRITTAAIGQADKKIMLSYVQKEARQHVLLIKKALAARGLDSVYLDCHEIHAGQDWQDSLNHAVQTCDVFVAIITNNYGNTVWTLREAKLADTLDKVVIPVKPFPINWPPRKLAIQYDTLSPISWKDFPSPRNHLEAFIGELYPRIRNTL